MSRREYSIRLLRIAEDDLTEIVTYIAADRPSAAEALSTRMKRIFQLRARNPHSGRIPDEQELTRLGYRYLVKITLFSMPSKENVHRILHGARDYLGLF